MEELENQRIHWGRLRRMPKHFACIYLYIQNFSDITLPSTLKTRLEEKRFPTAVFDVFVCITHYLLYPHLSTINVTQQPFLRRMRIIPTWALGEQHRKSELSPALPILSISPCSAQSSACVPKIGRSWRINGRGAGASWEHCKGQPGNH